MNSYTFQRTKPGALVVVVPIAMMIAAWFLAKAILEGADYYLLIPLVIAGAALIVLQALKDWRSGVLLFLTWMLFEDLVRKYLGNNMLVYFAKDGFLAFCCLSFYTARGPKRILSAKPVFLFPFTCFFFWSLLEVFNPNSPSVWYGLLGLKLYFGYAPLFFLGYALIKNESDLRRFLTVNMVIAALISLLGVLQGVTGTGVLTPAELAPDIRELGNLTRQAPITGERFLRPPSVFVSDGRFDGYLLLVFLLGLGATAYFFLRHLRGRKWMVVAMTLIMAGILIAAVRGTLMWAIISSAVFILAYAPEMQMKSARLSRITAAISVTAIVGILAMIFLSSYYSDALHSRVAFYQQTLLPSSSSFELGYRTWNYPTSELLKAFTFPNWPWGYGTGTASLGAQYVTRILGAPSTGIGVESGYGNLILEMGMPGLLLWLAWTSSLLVAEWKLVRQLRGTDLFPLGFVMFWYTFITLVPGMLNGIGLENYISSAFLFLLAGVLFSLPALKQTDSPVRTDTKLGGKAGATVLRRPLGRSLPLPG